MGNSIPGSTQFRYTFNQTGDVVKYCYYDIKGKNRFPPQPAEELTNARFQACLGKITIPSNMSELITNLTPKYKHRFVHKTNEVVEQLAQKKRQLQRYSNISPQRSVQKNNQIETRLVKIEQTPSTFKTLLNSLEKYLKDKDLFRQFMEMGGVARLVALLEREEKKNREGVQNNFNNQIELLKFFTQLAKQKNTKWLYMTTIETIPNYFFVLLKNFHPINISVAVPVLELSALYFWKTSTDLVEEQFEMYRKFHSYSWIMQPFTDTLISTNNIVMVYHILKFINEFVGSLIEDEKIIKFKQQLKRNRFEMILVTIKTRIQQKWYQIQYGTFDYIHRRLFDYKSKSNGKTDGVDKGILNQIFAKANRQSAAVDIQKLITNIIVQNMGENQQTIIIQQLDDQDQQNVFLLSGDQKKFGKLIIYTLRAIDNYFQLQQNVVGNNTSVMNQLQQREISDAFKSLRQACRESECEDILVQTFKGLSGFGRSNWIQLQNFMQESTLGSSKKSIEQASQRRQNESLKCQIEEKQKMIKNLIKEASEMKATVETLRSTVGTSPIIGNGTVTVNVNGGLPPPPIMGNSTLPPPPPSLGSTLSPPPSLSATSLPPPPPPLSSTSTGSVPSTLPSLLPPPSLTSALSVLPPPPTMIGLPSTIPNSLPPPPSLGSTLPSLPPPPSSLGSLPPPPPTIGTLPPSLPSIGGLLPPPGLPSIGLPPISGGLPSLPGLPLIGGLGGPKLKQKCKPSIPLKGCNVANLPYEKIKQSIWTKVDDTKVELDKQMLQLLFAKPDLAKASSKIQKVEITNELIVPKKEKVRLIEGERSKNIEIVLTKFRTDNKIICDALRSCSGKYATQNVLEVLLKILPSQDEQSLMKTYSGDVEQLAIPEKFFVEIIKVPDFRNRIKALLFRQSYQQSLYQLQFKQANISKALTKVKNNTRLHATLQTALALSNYLNGTTIKGGAWGFKLDSMQRFEEVKSADGKENLAFILIRQIWKKYPYPIFQQDEIEQYKSLSNTSIISLSTSLQQIRMNLNFTKKAVKAQIVDDPYDKIGSICEAIVIVVEQKLSTLTKMHQETLAAFGECSAFYCQDSSQPSEQFGKKVLGCILFICKCQETLHQLAQSKRKEQQRMAKKSSLTFKQPTSIPPPVKLPPRPIQPSSTTPPIRQVESKIVTVNEQHESKHKFDFVEQMKKKRETKRVNVRNSRFSKVPGGLNSSNQDFSHLGFIPQ